VIRTAEKRAATGKGQADEPLIVCEGLVKIYRLEEVELLALQGLDLLVNRGEVMAIVGQSGSGKSTLMNILGGLDRPTAGRVTVGGRDLLKLHERALNQYRRHNVGFVWQQTARNLIPYLNAKQNVELPMLMAGTRASERRRWASELLDAVGIGHRHGHRLDQMSGGEQQRVAIAVALANKPDLLLADEPTGELDSATARTIFDIFHKLNEQYGLTVLIVSHDPQIAQHVARVVAIRDGKTSSETLRQPVAAVGADGAGEGSEEQPTHVEYTVLDQAGRLQLPEEYRDRYGIGGRVTLETTPEGIVIKPVEGDERPVPRSLVESDEPPPPRPSLRSRLASRFGGKRQPEGDQDE
jgi:ABC-type lipoprotein export system ATPase subunit/bifunctional DNA-binding transcriptional regulator/antitoxin component of YhaV-PrlF toxin-antitoxin module